MNNFSKSLNVIFRAQIILEVILIFIISLLVSILRLNESLWEVLTTFPGQPKIFLLPLCWYISLYMRKAWSKTNLLYSDGLYLIVLKSSANALAIFAVLVLFTKYPIPRLWILLNFASITLLILYLRAILRRIVLKKLGQNTDLKYIFIGDTEISEKAFREFESHFGFIPQFTTIKPPTNTNKVEWMQEYRLLSKNNYFGVLVSYASISDASILKEISFCNRKQIVDMIIISRIAPIVPRFEFLDNPTLIRIAESSISSIGAIPKRILDIVLSLVAVITLLPLFLIISFAIKITSPGPVFFKQERLGYRGKLFTFIKFRSMYVESELNRSKVLGTLDAGIRERYRKDPRITPLGKFIRRWSIDEIPQFWNVLKGEMSIVGPRPILIDETAQVQSDFTIRFLAKPGLTGLWQVTGRKEVLWEDRMLRDLHYIEDWSFWKDSILIFKTILAVIKGDGAY